MADVSYLVQVNGNTVSNVQGFTLVLGRQKVSDPLRAGTGTIRGRRPDLLPTIEVGHPVRLEYQMGPGSYIGVLHFRVTDLRIIYGFTSSMDEWEMDVEDQFAIFGRAVVSTSWADGVTTIAAMQAVGTAVGVTVNAIKPAQSTVSAQTVTNENGLELLSRLAITEQSVFNPFGSSSINNLNVYGRGWQTSLQTRDASDDGTGLNPMKYDGLFFSGLADNFADKVVINPAGLAQQSAGTGNFSIELDSYSRTTGDAASLASYLLGVYDQQLNQPSVITMRASGQNNVTALSNMVRMCSAAQQFNIKFRGATYKAIVEGFTITGRPDDCLFTYYLSSPEYFPLFILNDAQFGVLDSNRLGY